MICTSAEKYSDEGGDKEYSKLVMIWMSWKKDKRRGTSKTCRRQLTFRRLGRGNSEGTGVVMKYYVYMCAHENIIAVGWKIMDRWGFKIGNGAGQGILGRRVRWFKGLGKRELGCWVG